jgi:probable rRNA maturation factor
MSPQATTLLFQSATPGLSRRGLRAFAKRLASEVAGGRAFCCCIARDKELRRLNREFRKQDDATDVLSFPAPAADGFLGEIAISFDRARQQAAERRHGVSQEIKILMLHGVLHLLGMDHETDRGRMARAERKWRASLRLKEGLIERVRP